MSSHPHWVRFGRLLPVMAFLLASASVRADRSAGDGTEAGVTRSPEFRGFWADVFHPGLQNAAQVDYMIARAVEGSYNAILPEVLAFHDNQYGSHGAYWESNIVARSSYVTGGFDPLEYMVQQAHANGLELHPWLVAFRVSSTWPPPGNPTLAAHPEWLMVPRGSMGSVAKVGNYYTLDPGSPDVQEYLVSIVRELVTNYEIDGIHWDYIRYIQTDAGYPADTSYPKSTLKRFQDITGYSGTPPSTGEPSWDDFRRRTITELVRRVRAEIPAITSNPRQPLRYTAALVTWYPANTNFHLTRPYYETFCDWEYWAYKGYLDATIPMCYFDENSYPNTYRAWVDNSVMWANNYSRHVYIGPGIYMNIFADSRTQMLYARNAGAHGLCTYSYRTTNDGGEPWDDWYPYVAANVFTAPASPPSMPWRDPATATEGTLYGRVIDAPTGEPIDDATVTISGVEPVQTDGNGFYILTRVPATAGGTSHDVTASKAGYTDHTKVGTVYAGDVSELDIPLGGCLDASDCDDGVFCNGAETCDPSNQCQPGTAPCPGDTWCDEAGDTCVPYGDGDFDGDADVDLDDYAAFQRCFGQLGTGGCQPGNMTGGDALIDLDDYALFATALTGP